jgi:hypothetical protein
LGKPINIDDNETNMAFGVEFIPYTGNKYALAPSDEHIRLYDVERGKVSKPFSFRMSQTVYLARCFPKVILSPTVLIGLILLPIDLDSFSSPMLAVAKI